MITTHKPVPEGWVLEQGDPSVGIFGYEVWHEDCPELTEDTEDEALATNSETLVGFTYVPRNGYVEVVTRTQFTCPLCGAVGDFYDTDISSFEGSI